MLFRQNTRKTGNNAVEMSQAFNDIALFERFTDLNLFKYTFNVTENALQFCSIVLILLIAVMVKGDGSGRLRIAN